MHVLVVTNNAARRFQIRSEIVREGFTVSLASSARAGLRALQTEKVDIVISDLYMPSMDGVEFHRVAQGISGRLPFIFISTEGDPSKVTQISDKKDCVVVRRESSVGEMLRHLQNLTAPHPHVAPHSPEVADTLPTPKPTMATHPLANAPLPKKDRIGKRILLVDDDDAFRFVVNEMLADEGFSITQAEDGSEAIDKLQTEQFDLVLLDIFMPTVSGYGVMKFISEHSIKTNVVIVSAYSDLKLAVEAKALGASDFIAKPLMRSDLLSTIDRILAG